MATGIEWSEDERNKSFGEKNVAIEMLTTIGCAVSFRSYRVCLPWLSTSSMLLTRRG